MSKKNEVKVVNVVDEKVLETNEIQVASETNEVVETTEAVAVTLESLGLVTNGKFVINGLVRNGKTILENRTVQLNKISKKAGVILGQLFHEKTNQLQKCEITIPVENLSAYIAPAAEVKTTTEVTEEVQEKTAI